MDHILAIFDREKRYVKRLAAFFESRTRMPFRIMAFDNRDKLVNFLMMEKASVLLIDKEAWISDLEELADQVIFLTGEKSEERLEKDFGGYLYPAVCKYQSGEAIAKKVLGICAVVETPILQLHPDAVGEMRAEVIGIYSPVKRSLQTSFSMVYSHLQAKNKKTLYLNFETFSGFGAWFRREYQTDLMDLMYFLDSPSEKFLLKLAGMVESFGGFDYIPPALAYEDFMLVSAKQWLKFIDTIAKKSGYEVVVLDLGDQMQGLFEVLDLCDKIYVLTKPDGIALAKTEDFEQNLRLSGRETILGKIVKCRLPIFKDMSQRAEDLCYSQLADYMKNKLGVE